MTLNATILEYGFLALSLIAVTILLVVGKLSAADGVPILTAIVGYGVGAAKGASLAQQLTKGGS